jgi:uncharacterized membrane protein YadS
MKLNLVSKIMTPLVFLTIGVALAYGVYLYTHDFIVLGVLALSLVFVTLVITIYHTYLLAKKFRGEK